MNDRLRAGSTLSLLVVAVLASAGVCAQNPQDLRLDAKPLHSATVTGDNVQLRIEGTDSEEIEASADSESVHLRVERNGDSGVVVGEVDVSTFTKIFGWTAPTVTVRMPRRLALSVKDGAGPLYVAGMRAKTSIVDASGFMSVRDQRGDLDVSDGSGATEIADVAGNVDLSDASGALTIRNVSGHVTLRRKTSGHATIDNVKGGVTAMDVAAKRISASHVEGGVTLNGSLRDR